MLKGFTHLPRLSPPILNPRIIKCRMSTAPINPKFVALEEGDGDAKGVVNGSRFRLVSYNILAQVYVKSSYFPYSPASCLKWKARSQAVLEDVRKFNADFLCIQELDEYDSFYKSKMESAGYSSMYVQRNGKKRDGCGIFYKNKSAELVLHEEIDYNDLVPSVEHENTSAGSDSDNNNNCDSKKTSDSDHGDPNDPQVRLKRDCVGILAAFKLNNRSQHIVIVANTHIYWDPEWIDVKLAQVKYLVMRLTRFAELIADKYSYLPSIIVAGDFNSTPGDKVYQYLTSTTNSAGANSSILPYKLCSLYGTNGGEPPFTNYTPGFTGTLDYIFLSNTSSLKPVTLLELPKEGSADIVGGLPNLHHPSDHLPIGADFKVLVASTSTENLDLSSQEASVAALKIE